MQLHGKTQKQNRAQRSVSARRGVSLIEVLVVLVLLVTGILVIIRLYPSGFFSIQSTGNAALADGLGNAALGTQAQDAASLPESILPVNSATIPNSNSDLVTVTNSTDAGYDPDNPDNLDNARRVMNETITVPSPSNGQSVYAVKYGPIVFGTTNPLAPIDPAAANVTQYPKYITVNSLPWAIQNGSSTDEPNPKDLLALGRPNYLVDYTNGQIALPYADYTQQFVLTIYDANNVLHTLYLTVPKQHAVDNTTYLNGPITNDKLAYQDSAADNYNGKWFGPADTTLNYVTLQSQLPTTAPATLVTPWKSVMLYRQFNAVPNTTAFTTTSTSDPYQFKLTAENIGTANANPGAIAFNPLAGGANGLPPLKAQISYVTYSWGILREDHDIPALSGTSTTIIRTTVPNLRQAGAANPDNTISQGLANSGKSIYILNLDTGMRLTTPGAPDPTNPDAPIVDEDTAGTPIAPNAINVSFATGRLTFGSNAFGDNPNGTTPVAHRVRLFYGSELGWTVAVQKAPSYFAQNILAPPASDTKPLKADEYALDTTNNQLYFARCNAGKTVEIDGTTIKNDGIAADLVPKPFTDAISIDSTLNTVGATNVRLDLTDGTKLGQPVPSGANVVVTITAVRGLSARAVVAWKERDQWKVHSVDTVLNRTQ